MRMLITLAVSIALLAGWSAGSTAAASTLCVGPGFGCYPTIQDAVDAAQDGDTIGLGPGTFAGGVTIDKSVSLVGVSAGATTIEGGGPVITIGDGTANLTVSISRVTITGGFNDSKPESQFGTGFLHRRRWGVDPGSSEQHDRRDGDDLGQRHQRQPGHSGSTAAALQ